MAFSLEAFRTKNLVHNSFDIWYIHGNVATTHENEAAVYKKKNLRITYPPKKYLALFSLKNVEI